MFTSTVRKIAVFVLIIASMLMSACGDNNTPAEFAGCNSITRTCMTDGAFDLSLTQQYGEWLNSQAGQ